MDYQKILKGIHQEIEPYATIGKQADYLSLIHIQMCIRDRGLSEVPDNFFITNPKNSKMLEKLKLELIPRNIIFDKQGNIVEMNAPRPSDKQVTTTIDKYLK